MPQTFLKTKNLFDLLSFLQKACYNEQQCDMILKQTQIGEVKKMETLEEYSELVSLFDKQLQFAQNIQKKIIPKSSEFVSNDYHLFARLHPFRKVGGDFYDFHTFDNGQVSFILADATGHGIDAAMITSMVKLIYSYAMDNPKLQTHPAALMQQIERDIEKQLTATFFSALTLFLDPKSQTLRYANAGHPAGLLIHDEIQLLKPTLPLLGLHHMMSSINYNDCTLPFKPGSKLLLFTDGLIDTINENNESFSIEGVLRIVRENKDLPVNNLCRKLLDYHSDFRGGMDINDDICLLGIEYDRCL